ncbi:MAG: hypothetical protein Q4D58_03925 [Synergistaceae bacterium]|nr:hypothetical protein [Synergistaceae bacterium]
MRSTGYVGPQDEVCYYWMEKVRETAELIADIPDIYRIEVFYNSIKWNKQRRPDLSFKLIEHDIMEKGSFYRKRGRFDVVLFPNGASLLRSPLDMKKIFYSVKSKGELTDELKESIENNELDGLTEFFPHVTEVDFLQEILFSPRCITLDVFSKEAASLLLRNVPKPANMKEWIIDSAVRRICELCARIALVKWTEHLKGRVALRNKEQGNVKGYKRLTGYYGKELVNLTNMLISGQDKEFTKDDFKKLAAKSLKEEICELGNLILRFKQEELREIANIILTAYSPMSAGAFAPGESYTPYMGGTAECLPFSVAGHNEEYLYWLLYTAALYPDSVIYALALDEWEEKQYMVFDSAVNNIRSNNLLIWQSTFRTHVPIELLKSDYVHRKGFIGQTDSFCFKMPDSLSPVENLEGRNMDVYNKERLPKSAGKTDELYKFGFLPPDLTKIAQEQEESVSYDTMINYGNALPLVNVPFIELPEDRIQRPRDYIYEMAGLKGNQVNKKHLQTNMPIDYEDLRMLREE